MPGNTVYAAYAKSKSAIIGLTRSLARELGKHDVCVNALKSGWVIAQWQRDLWVTEQGIEQHLSRQCFKNFLSPSNIVTAPILLASRSSQMIVGQAIVFDLDLVVTGL